MEISAFLKAFLLREIPMPLVFSACIDDLGLASESLFSRSCACWGRTVVAGQEPKTTPPPVPVVF